MKRFENMLVVGLDVGNYNSKTTTQCFVSGVEEVGKEAIFDNLLHYNDRSYTLSSVRMPVQTDKTESQEMLLLSLIGIARELIANGISGGTYDLVLSVGLPPGFISIDGMKARLQEYCRKRFSFQFNNSLYDLHVRKVFVCPQDYAAVLAPIRTEEMQRTHSPCQRPIEVLAKEPLSLLFDFGGGTFDVVGLEYGKPIPAYHFSWKDGIVVSAYNDINAEIRGATGNDLLESVITNVLIGENARATGREQEVIGKHILLYGDKLLKKLTEHQLPIGNSYCLALGGGAAAIFDYWKQTGQFAVLDSLPEIRANAMGFEEMAYKALTGKR